MNSYCLFCCLKFTEVSMYNNSFLRVLKVDKLNKESKPYRDTENHSSCKSILLVKVVN